MAQLPPADVPASTLFAQLTARKRPSWIVRFPDEAINVNVRMVCLTHDEQTAAARDATAKTRAMFAGKAAKPADGIDEADGYGDVYKNVAVKELLWRCCKDPDDPEEKKSFFRQKEDIGQYLSVDEAAALARDYVIGAQRVSPWIVSLTQEEMDAWNARLEEGADALPLGRLSPELVTHLWLYTAARYRSLLTERSSPGSSSSNGPTDEAAASPAPEP